MSSSQARGRSRPRLDRVRSEEEGPDDGCPRAGLQRLPRQPRARRPQHLRPVRRRCGLPGQADRGPAGAVRPQREATVFAGDNIGASPLANALFHEEPATIIANLMHVDFASVGNHEFDKGTRRAPADPERRLPAGGCTGAPYLPPNGSTTNRYPGANFQYLVGQRHRGRHRQDALPGVRHQEVQRARRQRQGRLHRRGPQGHPDDRHAERRGRADLRRRGRGRQQGGRAISRPRASTIPILVIHQGGFQSGARGANGCAGNLAGSPIATIAAQLDPSIKIIISAHTHAEYRCTITTPDGVTRLVTSASSFGRILSDLTLTPRRQDRRAGRARAPTNIDRQERAQPPGPGVDCRQPDPSQGGPDGRRRRQPVRRRRRRRWRTG